MRQIFGRRVAPTGLGADVFFHASPAVVEESRRGRTTYLSEANAPSEINNAMEATLTAAQTARLA
eukprot:11301642-Alexandrium_andersonii.AAC.1